MWIRYGEIESFNKLKGWHSMLNFIIIITETGERTSENISLSHTAVTLTDLVSNYQYKFQRNGFLHKYTHASKCQSGGFVVAVVVFFFFFFN